MEELRRDLRIKSQELEAKNAAANDKLKKMMKDQQEAEKKKVHRKELVSLIHEYIKWGWCGFKSQIECTITHHLRT